MIGEAWRLYRERFLPVAGLFAVCFLVLTPLPRVLAFEVPVVVGVPLGALIEITVPAFGATLALVGATQVLAGDTSGFRSRLRPALAAGLLAALVAGVIALLPYYGLLLSFLLGLLTFGPPIIGQAIAVEGLTLRAAIERAGDLTDGIRGRVFLYLVNVGVGLGILSLLLIGGAMSVTSETSEAVRVLMNSVYQTVVLGALCGFLAAVEYVIFTELRARPKTADAIPG